MSTTTVRSTTGTAPVTITDRGDGTVSLLHEDGSGQVYRRSDLLAALGVAVVTFRGDDARLWASLTPDQRAVAAGAGEAAARELADAMRAAR